VSRSSQSHQHGHDSVSSGTQRAPLAANREVFGNQKESIYGENAIINGPHGAAHLLKNSADY